jgi:hypothetical protein
MTVVLLTIGAVLAACSAPGTPAVGGAPASSGSALSMEQSRQAGARAALQVMSEALASGSVERFVSIVNPEATIFRAHRAAVFAGLNRMQFQSVAYSWDGRAALPVLAGAGYGAGAIVAVVTMRNCLSSWDAGCVADVVPLTFASVNGHWYLESDRQGADRLPLGVDGEPWNLGEVSVATQPDVLVVVDSAHASTNKALAERVQAAVTAVHALWSVPSWNGRVVARGMPAQIRQKIRRGTWSPTLHADAQFFAGSAAQQADAYTSAWLTCLYIADHYGQEALRALFDAAAQEGSRATPAHVERDVLSTVLHTDRAGLARAVKVYARSLS